MGDVLTMSEAAKQKWKKEMADDKKWQATEELARLVEMDNLTSAIRGGAWYSRLHTYVDARIDEILKEVGY
jgi:hypothetical protein